jgi:hypothetical protein
MEAPRRALSHSIQCPLGRFSFEGATHPCLGVQDKEPLSMSILPSSDGPCMEVAGNALKFIKCPHFHIWKN